MNVSTIHRVFYKWIPNLFYLLVVPCVIVSAVHNSAQRNVSYPKVVSIHKKSDMNLAINFRPVSFLPIFSKIFGKLVSKIQFGFRKKMYQCLMPLWTFSSISYSLKKVNYIMVHNCLIRQQPLIQWDTERVVIIYLLPYM